MSEAKRKSKWRKDSKGPSLCPTCNERRDGNIFCSDAFHLLSSEQPYWPET